MMYHCPLKAVFKKGTCFFLSVFLLKYLLYVSVAFFKYLFFLSYWQVGSLLLTIHLHFAPSISLPISIYLSYSYFTISISNPPPLHHTMWSGMILC